MALGTRRSRDELQSFLFSPERGERASHIVLHAFPVFGVVNLIQGEQGFLDRRRICSGHQVRIHDRLSSGIR
jgi:hypothetical protein